MMRKYFRLILAAAISTVAGFSVSCSSDSDDDGDKAAYYLVGEKYASHSDSYVLRLTGSEEIKKADQILKDSLQLRPIILARISKKIDDTFYINKDLVGGKTWSWHISGFIEFADFTAEIFDAHPGYVEDNYDEWVRITKDVETGEGVIGFWNYTLIRKVSKDELK